MIAAGWLVWICLPAVMFSQAPKFEDYPATVDTSFRRAPLQLILNSERMFRTRLTEASNLPPNFAGTLRLAWWGCGSNCGSRAFVDLQTGSVQQLRPIALGASGWERWMLRTADGGLCGWYDGAGVWGRLDSRLLLVRCGKKLIERPLSLVPDSYYLLWDGGKFRLLHQVRADTSPPPADAQRLDQ